MAVADVFLLKFVSLTYMIEFLVIHVYVHNVQIEYAGEDLTVCIREGRIRQDRRGWRTTWCLPTTLSQ